MTTAVFDLGGVVVTWDPVPAIAAAVGRERAERFIHGGAFDFVGWNLAQDAGRPWAEAEAEAVAEFPEFAEEIVAYRANFALSLTGLVPGTAELLQELRGRGVRLVALTNWSADTMHSALEVFPEVFALFEDIVISGTEGVVKPDPEIFRILALRLGHPIDGVFFADDSPANVDAARAAGMDAVRFTDSTALGTALRERGLLQ